MMSTWVVGGLIALCGAATYAELGSMMPHAGGEYVYLRGVYGDSTAFLYMWTWFAVAKPASIAAVTSGGDTSLKQVLIAMMQGAHFHKFLKDSADDRLFLRGYP